MAGLRALPEAVVPLHIYIKQALFVKACDLKLMIHVGRQHKIILLPNQPEKIEIRLSGGHVVAVHENMAAPPRPILLQRLKGIESAGVDSLDNVILPNQYRDSRIKCKPSNYGNSPRTKSVYSR